MKPRRNGEHGSSNTKIACSSVIPLVTSFEFAPIELAKVLEEALADNAENLFASRLRRRLALILHNQVRSVPLNSLYECCRIGRTGASCCGWYSAT